MTLLAAKGPHGAAALGDPDEWVDLHGDALLRYALLRINDRATAEDLVQETLLAAWHGREAFDGKCAPRTWMIAILKRRLADAFRRTRRRGPSEDVSALDRPSQRPDLCEAETAEFWNVVTGCTGDLPEHLATAFRLRTFGDADPETICENEGISRKNLSVRLHRARQLLRRCLEVRWFGEPSSPDALRPVAENLSAETP